MSEITLMMRCVKCDAQAWNGDVGFDEGLCEKCASIHLHRDMSRTVIEGKGASAVITEIWERRYGALDVDCAYHQSGTGCAHSLVTHWPPHSDRHCPFAGSKRLEWVSTSSGSARGEAT